ncbi:MAG: DUF2796 domain-containing protein [Burkholderiaceae bacterium]|nr:DUF2796 domain-containing protein [Burkholderiaceae bacterium]
MKPIRAWAAVWCLSITGAALAQGRPHVHGVAQLDIAIETGKITLQLETPLDSLLGFERAPRGVAETRRVETAVAALKAAGVLFRFTPTAGCAVASVDLSSAALKLGSPGPAEQREGHADLDATYVFNCTDVARATEVDVGLFDAFIRMQSLKVEVATAKGQFKRDLKRPSKRVSLVR